MEYYAVFHRKEDTKPLKHLAFRCPPDLTTAEANDRLDRRCYRPLRKFADNGEIHAADHDGTTVYTHTWLNARLINPPTSHPTIQTPMAFSTAMN
jgi:hypothetical protein